MATNYKMPEGATAVLQEGPIPFHLRGWDLQSNTVVIVNNMQLFTAVGVVRNHGILHS